MRRQLGFAAVLVMSLLGIASARGPPVDGPADACQACLVSVRILEDFLCDPAATDFLVDFVEKQICAHMGDQAQCHNLAEGLLPTIIQWFRASATPASLCSAAGVCGAAVLEMAPLNKPSLRVRDTSECAMCKFVVRRQRLGQQTCDSLPDDLTEGCTDFVNTFGSKIADLGEDLDVETVCALVGSCLETLVAVPPPALPVALMQALAGTQLLRRPPPPPVFSALLGLPPPLFGPPGAPGMMGMMMPHGAGMGMGPMGMGPGSQKPSDQQDQSPEHDQEKDKSSAMPPRGGLMGPFANDACDYCKMAVLEAHSLISNPQVQAEVTNYTKAVCDSFPSFAEPCKSYVDLYAPMVFTLLEQYLVPDVVCVEAGLCPPPPADGAGHPRSWMCWLMDGWLGDVLRHMGLGGMLPHHEHGHDQAGVHHMQVEQPQLPAQ